ILRPFAATMRCSRGSVPPATDRRTRPERSRPRKREDAMTFSELVDRHIGLFVRKQMALSDFLGKHSYRFDLGKGTIDFGKGPGLFGKRRVYPCQVLGTESETSGTWLWA